MAVLSSYLRLALGIAAVILLVAAARLSISTPAAESAGAVREDAVGEEAAREDALQRAKVWLEPSVRIEDARLDSNPGGAGMFQSTDVVQCRLVPTDVGGTTPKFDCALPTGEILRVKYGRDNPEIYAEVAATRLLSALGFPTDAVSVVSRVECDGCGSAAQGHPRAVFEDAVIERKHPGRRIETRKIEGWKWHELTRIDPARGGASRAEVDALRLMAVFLAHWDNKADNQRLICLDAGDGAGAGNDVGKDVGKDAAFRCAQPLAMVQDLGGTFGPFKVELKGWVAAPIWSDPATCTVSMRSLPYSGASFHDSVISEEGRRFLASRLGKLSKEQILQLFEGARFVRAPSDNPAAGQVENWVQAFLAKRDAIANRPPCPT